MTEHTVGIESNIWKYEYERGHHWVLRREVSQRHRLKIPSVSLALLPSSGRAPRLPGSQLRVAYALSPGSSMDCPNPVYDEG